MIFYAFVTMALYYFVIIVNTSMMQKGLHIMRICATNQNFSLYHRIMRSHNELAVPISTS